MPILTAKDIADNLTCSITEEIYALVIDNALDKNRMTNCPFDLSAFPTYVDGYTFAGVGCGNEAASKLDILPEDLRQKLEQKWKSEFVGIFRGYAIKHNEDPTKYYRLPVPKPGAESYAEVYAFLEKEKEKGNKSLFNYVRNWFNSYECSFDVKCKPKNDYFDLEIGVNTWGLNSDEVTSQTIFSRSVSNTEIEEYLENAESQEKGFQKLAKTILNECKEAQKEEEESSLSPC